ncbi:MAG: Trm112 family protein [Thermodesulfobacteriota bacterium]
MSKQSEELEKQNLRCPECHQPLKRRRTRRPDECEMVCGGCGASFDVCDQQTMERLKKGE